MCDQEGHKSFDCAERKRLQQQLANAATTFRSDGTDPKNVALISAVMSEKLCDHLAHHARQGELVWVVDSGCTAHMVGSEAGLADVKWGKGTVIVAGGQTLNSVGVGRIEATIQTDKDTGMPVTFEEVLLVPGLGRNLLSVKKIYP